MAQSSACRICPQNPLLGGKNKLAGAISIKYNTSPTVLRAFTPTIAPPVVPTLSFMAQYLEDDL